MEWKNESRKDKLVPFLKGLKGHDFILGTVGSHCMILSGVWHGQICVFIKSSNSAFALLNLGTWVLELTSECPCLGDAHSQPQADAGHLKKQNSAFTPGEQ